MTILSWCWSPGLNPRPLQLKRDCQTINRDFQSCLCSFRFNIIFSSSRMVGRDGLGIGSRQGRDFPRPSRLVSRAHPASCTICTESFSLKVKRPGRGVDHPHPSSAEVKEAVELYFSSPSGPSLNVTAWPLPLLSRCIITNGLLHQSFRPAFMYFLSPQCV